MTKPTTSQRDEAMKRLSDDGWRPSIGGGKGGAFIEITKGEQRYQSTPGAESSAAWTELASKALDQ